MEENATVQLYTASGPARIHRLGDNHLRRARDPSPAVRAPHPPSTAVRQPAAGAHAQVPARMQHHVFLRVIAHVTHQAVRHELRALATCSVTPSSDLLLHGLLLPHCVPQTRSD